MTDETRSIFDKDFPTLLPHHLEQLRASGIVDDVIRERGYESVIGSHRLKELGFADYQCRRVGILLPVVGPDGSNGLYQYRPDNPRTERGTGKVFKYETPANKGLRLDVPPRGRPFLDDPSVPIWITEGIKKGDAGASHGLCVVTLLGVWGFRGRNDLHGVAWLADWQSIAVNDRVVNICFDSDVMTNAKVKYALDLLTEMLHRKAATIRHIFLPGNANGEKVGLDDFLLTHAVEELERYAVTPTLVPEPKTPAIVLKLQSGEDRHFTDTGNAYRLVAMHGDNLRYCYPWGKWLCWNGKRWEADQRGQVMQWAKETVKAIYHEAGRAGDPDHAKMIAEWAMASESVGKLAAMLEAAKDELPIAPDELDADPWLFNCTNGTLDLRSGELRPHRREDLLTKMSPVAYDPHGKCRTFKRFLIRILAGRRDLIRFVQRAVGYSLTSDVSEQVFFFLFGQGANGKSTFLNTMLGILGDYGTQAAPGLLMAKNGETHPTELADLAGVRFLSTVEIAEGREMAESLVKQITGGDPVKARRMREDFWRFMPTHKIWLAANHKPVIKGSDDAIWRRVHLIPFEVVIPKEQRDRKLGEKLKLEYAGILAWAMRGCLSWQRTELGVPSVVSGATESYRKEMDILATFFADCCTTGPNIRAPKGLLYKTYKEWCETNGERYENQRAFRGHMLERGYGEVNGTGGLRMWIGVGLRAKDEAQEHEGAESKEDSDAF